MYRDKNGEIRALKYNSLKTHVQNAHAGIFFTILLNDQNSKIDRGKRKKEKKEKKGRKLIFVYLLIE